MKLRTAALLAAATAIAHCALAAAGNAWVVCSNSDYPDAPLTLREFEVRRSVSADSGKSELLYEEGWGQSPCFMPTYDLDGIGNLLQSTFNAATNAYTANCLNQYTSILCDSVTLCEPTYYTDGNMLSDGILSFTYDAASRLKTVLEPHGDSPHRIRAGCNGYSGRA